MSAPSLLDASVIGGKSPVDLEFQTFSTTQLGGAATAAASSSSSSRGAVLAGGSNGGHLSPARAAGGVAAGSGLAGAQSVDGDAGQLTFNPAACFMPSFYKTMFDVDTNDVVLRMKEAASPLSPRSFFHFIGTKPDFYGPTWIPATLVFIIAAASNFSSYLSFVPTVLTQTWHYDFKLVTFALFCVYGFSIGTPVITWVIANYLGTNVLVPTQLICIYGYAVTWFVPAALLCTIPSSAAQWVFVSLAMVLSSLFIIRNVFPAVKDQLQPQSTRTLLVSCAAGQIAFGVVLKMYFFTWN